MVYNRDSIVAFYASNVWIKVRCSIISASSAEGVQCGSVICVNGGECATTDGNVKCQCPQGFAGEDCGTGKSIAIGNFNL